MAIVRIWEDISSLVAILTRKYKNIPSDLQIQSLDKK